MPLAEFDHLWNGTEAGWTIQVTRRNEHDVSVAFRDPGATVADIAKLRQLVDELRGLSAVDAQKRLAKKTRVALGRKWEIEAHQLERRGRELGLRVELEARRTTSYLPVNELTKSALVIEDDDLARRVCEEAISRGVKVVEVEAC